MPCVDDNALSAVLDGSVKPPERAAFLNHIEECGECRRLVATVISPEHASDLGTAIREGDRFGRYQVVGTMGRGGMGVVYAARDPELSRDVALKLIRRRHRERDIELTERLRRESRAMAKLSHPNVTAVYDVGVGDAGIFVALELVDGTSLRRWLEEERDRADIIGVLRRAGTGLLAAHREGIIHRDFKPDNVLVAGGGDTVKVSDFGLAQLLSEGASQTPPEDGEAQLAAGSGLSGAGKLIGTPAYMAPEQLTAGGAVDERADQFAFFVTLWEALFGERPFSGETPEALRAAIKQGPPAPGASVPRWLADALERGLRFSAAERFASMHEALAALQPPRSRRPALLAAALLVLLLFGGAALFVSRDDNPCETGAETMAALWTFERRIKVARALVETGAVNGAFTAENVLDSLDRGTARWAQTHREACLATKRGHQSAELLDRRNFCLDGKRREMAALIDRLENADSSLAASAAQATVATTDISRCSDLGALSATLPPPRGDAREAVSEVQESMATLRTQLRTSNFDGLLDAARAHRERATEVGYRPLLAEAQLLVAQILDELDQAEKAAEAYREAALTAAGSRHDHVAAEAWNELLFTVGYNLASPERGLEIAEQAKAAIERLGGDTSLEATRLGNAALVAYLGGDAETAQTWFGQAIELWGEAGLGEGIEATAALDGLAEIHRDRGELSRTAELNQKTLAIRERVLGKHHPHLAASLDTLAGIHYLREEYGEAETLLERALAIQRSSLPETHRDIAVTLVLQGLVWGATQPEKAEPPMREALAIQIENLGANHPEVGKSHLNFGSVLADLGKHEEAREQYLAGIEVAKVAFGQDHSDYGLYLYYLADLDRQRDRCADALPTYRRAIELLSKLEGSFDVVTMQSGLGECLIELGRAKEAITPLKAALKRLGTAEVDVAETGEPLALLGMAHYEIGQKRAGRGEVQRALEIFRTKSERFAEEIGSLEEWLATHR